jgi:hypothetical protein
MKARLFTAALAITCAHAQTPDLSGVWLPDPITNIASGREVPLQAAAKIKFRENSGKQSETDRRCLPPGVPRIMFLARPFEIVQTPHRILFLFEGSGHVWRQIWTDGRPHPSDPNPDWLGHSIGHWEGGTLVVDTVGFNDKTWLDDAGHPHTEQLHVIEKFTRTKPLAMKYEVVIDDPGAYMQTWAVGSTFAFRPGERLAEDICLDKISK